MAKMTIVHFNNSDEQLKGFVEEYDPAAGGFFILPRDALSRNERVWINNEDVRGVFFVQDWNDPAPTPAAETYQTESLIIKEGVPETDEPETPPKTVDRGDFDPSEYTILVVDDEENIVKLVEINLAKRGFKVLKAYDGDEAIDLIRERRPHLVVCDIMMPTVDGYGVLKALKADPETSSIPFVALTAKAQYKDVFEGWQKGVDSYITKPFRPDALIEEISNILNPPGNTQDI